MSNKSSKKARSSAQILTEIAAITAGRKLKDLVLELSLANARELASAETPLKKNKIMGVTAENSSSIRQTLPCSAAG